MTSYKKSDGNGGKIWNGQKVKERIVELIIATLVIGVFNFGVNLFTLRPELIAMNQALRQRLTYVCAQQKILCDKVYSPQPCPLIDFSKYQMYGDEALKALHVDK